MLKYLLTNWFLTNDEIIGVASARARSTASVSRTTIPESAIWDINLNKTVWFRTRTVVPQVESLTTNYGYKKYENITLRLEIITRICYEIFQLKIFRIRIKLS